MNMLMLNKEVCSKCWGKYWDENDKKRWKRGIVACKYSIRERADSMLFTGTIKINEEPPEDCKYKFEHIILGQKNGN